MLCSLRKSFCWTQIIGSIFLYDSGNWCPLYYSSTIEHDINNTTTIRCFILFLHFHCDIFFVDDDSLYSRQRFALFNDELYFKNNPQPLVKVLSFDLCELEVDVFKQVDVSLTAKNYLYQKKLIRVVLYNLNIKNSFIMWPIFVRYFFQNNNMKNNLNLNTYLSYWNQRPLIQIDVPYNAIIWVVSFSAAVILITRMCKFNIVHVKFTLLMSWKQPIKSMLI